MSSSLFRCSTCGAAPVVGTIAHPLHFKNSTVGIGECRYEQVVYCPRCQDQPDYNGAIEYYDQTYDEYAAQRFAILHRAARALRPE